MPRARRNFIAIDNRMPRHPKIEPLSDAAFRLLITLWAECDEHETDGSVKAATWARRGTAKARRELLDAGMAEPDGEDYIMHDYLEHQRSAAEIRELRGKRSAAGSKGGKATARAAANAQQPVQQVLQQTDHQVLQQSGSKPVAGTEDRDRDNRTTEGGERTETLRAAPATIPTPDGPRCARHPDGNPTDEPCAGCARVREHRDRLEQRDTERRQAELEQRRRDCPDCEGTGKVLDPETKLPTTKRCEHKRARRAS